MATIPSTQTGAQFVGVKQAIVNHELPVPEVGPTQLLVKVEACGICFSDVKLINAFDTHPRRSAITSGLSAEELAEIPTYHTGDEPVVPGHEPVGRVVAVGDQVKDHKVGDRVLIQTDYKHLPTARSNAAFGYNFDGALEEYALMDERVVTDPETGTSFLIPVSDDPAAAAVALIEPWACVEAAYSWGERQTLKKGGDLLIVADEGNPVEGIDALIAQSKPGSVSIIGAEYSTASEYESLDELKQKNASFDDIVYFGASAETIETLESLLGQGGIIDVVLGGKNVDRSTNVDVGRVHYDLIRYTGTRGTDAAEGYARIPASAQIRPNDKIAVVGAAGPMGLMHCMLISVSGVPGISMDAVDVDDARLERLERVVAPAAKKYGVPAKFHNSKTEPLEEGYNYVAAMVPAPFLIKQAVEIATPGSVVNAFAGFPIGTTAELDTDKIVGDGVYLVGTSGSRIEDMVAIKEKLEAGIIDTNVSLWAVTGLAGFVDALGMVENRTSGGKIMVYPELAELGVVKLDDMADVMPEVAAKMKDGFWTAEAEKQMLATAK